MVKCVCALGNFRNNVFTIASRTHGNFCITLFAVQCVSLRVSQCVWLCTYVLLSTRCIHMHAHARNIFCDAHSDKHCTAKRVMRNAALQREYATFCTQHLALSNVYARTHTHTIPAAQPEGADAQFFLGLILTHTQTHKLMMIRTHTQAHTQTYLCAHKHIHKR